MPRPMKELTEVEHHTATLFASLELSQTSWLVTSLSPGSVTMSKHSISAGDGAGLLGLLARMRVKAESVAGVPVEIVVIQEAGLDGFWVHRLLEANRIKSHVVDAASISVPRRRRRAKTDAIDGETLLRTLRAWTRGEPRVCAMVAPPSPEQEDQRRISREELETRNAQNTSSRHHLFFQSSTPDELRRLCRGRLSYRLRSHRGCLQNSGQTTSVLLRYALDSSGRSDHPQPPRSR